MTIRIGILFLAVFFTAFPAFAASLSLSPADFQNAPTLNRLHRGLNVHILGENLQWDKSVPAEANFYDVAADERFIDNLKNLNVGSLRIPGGGDANSFDVESGNAWISWALRSDKAYNATIHWDAWWDFYQMVGAPSLMTTANVYQNGNPEFSDWNDPEEAAVHWLKLYEEEAGLHGGYWESGNETYIEGLVPGMDFIPETASDQTSYPERACRFAEALHGADPSAKTGLVLYEHGMSADFLRTEDLLDAVNSTCGLEEFDFFILHDYAPLVPVQDGEVIRFSQDGVEKALAYQELVKTISELKSGLHGEAADKPVYVTEYGLLYDLTMFGEIWNSEFYDKGVSLLLIHHMLDLIDQGASGLWYWEALSKWFRLIDPETLKVTASYDLMKQAFRLRGKLISVPISDSEEFSVKGPVGIGCDPDGNSCWHTALEKGGSANGLSYVRAFAAKRGERAKEITLVLFNFSTRSETLAVGLKDFESLKGSTIRLEYRFASWNLGMQPVAEEKSSLTKKAFGACQTDLVLAPRSVTFFSVE